MIQSSPRGVRPAYIVPFLIGQFVPFAALALALLMGSARAEPVKAQLGVHYGSLPAQSGNLFLPTTPAPPGGRPAILLIHGGGWTGGNRFPLDWLSGQIAAMGAVAYNIDYRLADPAQPGTAWPAQRDDTRLALQFLREHAAQFGLDPARIGAMGDSAGAQLALLLGDAPDPVQAVVDQYGPTDLATLPLWSHNAFQALFHTALPSAATLAAASPLRSVTKHSPPTYIIQGDRDQTVPPSQSIRLQDALRAAGVPVTYVTYHGDHGYAGLTPQQTVAIEMDGVRWLLTTLQQTPAQ